MIRTRMLWMAAGLFTISVMLTGCPLSLSPHFGWFWVLGADGDDAAKAVDRTWDGGFILAGYTEAEDIAPDNAVLIKLNRIGQVQWRAEFGDHRDDTAEDVKQTRDGGFVLAGRFGGFEDQDSDGFLIKTDRHGNERWRTIIDTGGVDYAVSVDLLSDGGFLVAAQKDSFEGDGAFVKKYDRRGNEVWSVPAGAFTHAAQAIALPNGNALLGSWSIEPGETFEESTGMVHLLKVDAHGHVLWSRDIPSAGAVELRSIARAKDGGFVLCGQDDFMNEDSKLFLWKTDAEGNLLWQQEYGREGRETGKKVRVARDGGFLIAGKIRLPGELPHALLVKTDANGNLEWEKAYGRGDRDVLYDVVPLLDGTFFAVGETDSFSGGDDELHSEVFALNTDRNGNVPFIGLSLD